MSKLQKILLGAGIGVALVVVVLVSVFSKSEAKGTEVYVAKAEKGDIASSVTATGRIEARTKVNVQSSVIGEIVQLPVKEGDVVKKGDLLVQIDPERYRQEVDRLEAMLRMQRIERERAQVTLENQRRTFVRQRQLFDASGIISQQTLEDTELQVRTSEIAIQSLAEQITQAEAALLKSKDDLAKTTLRSPIDGTVTQLNAEKGEITLTGTMNNPGTVIMVVSDMSEILATVDVDETRVVQVEPGQSAKVVVDAIGQTKPYTGKVAEIRGTATRRQGQDAQIFEVKIALDQIDAKLRPGMTAKATIETQRADGVVTIPIQSVLLRSSKEIADAASGKKDDKKDDAKKTDEKAEAPPPSTDGATEAKADTETAKKSDEHEVVFRMVDGKAVLTPVKSGISDETSVAILEGLEAGETVVTGPYRSVKKLKHGEAIREKKDKAGAESSEETDDESAVQVEVD